MTRERGTGAARSREEYTGSQLNLTRGETNEGCPTWIYQRPRPRPRPRPANGGPPNGGRPPGGGPKGRGPPKGGWPCGGWPNGGGPCCCGGPANGGRAANGGGPCCGGGRPANGGGPPKGCGRPMGMNAALAPWAAGGSGAPRLPPGGDLLRRRLRSPGGGVRSRRLKPREGARCTASTQCATAWLLQHAGCTSMISPRQPTQFQRHTNSACHTAAQQAALPNAPHRLTCGAPPPAPAGRPQQGLPRPPAPARRERRTAAAGC